MQTLLAANAGTRKPDVESGRALTGAFEGVISILGEGR